MFISCYYQFGDARVKHGPKTLLPRHENSNIRWAAVLAIADLGANASEGLLRECLKGEPNKDVRNKIKEILN